MNTPTAQSMSLESKGVWSATGRAALRLAWHAIRLPILALLLVLEPFVRVVLSALAALGIFMTLFFEFLIRLPHFPFALMLAISAGFAMLLVPYYLLIRLFSAH